jgi:hypothetical protein
LFHAKLNIVIVEKPLASSSAAQRHSRRRGRAGKYSELSGDCLENFQWVTGQESGRNYQDYYSNSLGRGFYKSYNNLLFSNPQMYTEYLRLYLNNPLNR